MTAETMTILKNVLIKDMQAHPHNIARNALVYAVVTALEKLIAFDRKQERGDPRVIAAPEEGDEADGRDRDGGQA